MGKTVTEMKDKGKEKEFENIVREYKSSIYTVCFMFAENSDEADDLFQEILINIWQGFQSFKGESKLSTWIWRISFNTCISQERKKIKNSVPLSMAVNLYEDDDDDSKQVQMLYKRVHRLKPFDRAIVMLWLEGMPYDDIAAIVGISTKNVSVRLVRIREELKKMSNQ